MGTPGKYGTNLVPISALARIRPEGGAYHREANMSVHATALHDSQHLRSRGDASHSVYSKIKGRIVPLLLIAYMVAYLDRINIGYAQYR
jgi:hypothetical protein